MKMKIASVLTVLLTLALCSGAMAQSTTTRYLELGVDGKPVGVYCCIQETCLIARDKAECEKVEGKVVENCEACEKPQP